MFNNFNPDIEDSFKKLNYSDGGDYYVMHRIVEIFAHKMNPTNLLNEGFITSFEPAKKFSAAKRSHGISFTH